MTFRNSKKENNAVAKITTFTITALLLLVTTAMASEPAYAQPAEGSVLATLSGCCGSGVGVGFDGTNLYWMDFGGATLHKITTSGTFVADIPITGCSATVISFDSTRGMFWGAAGTQISLIDPATGNCTPQFNVAGNLPGDCDNGFGCLGLIDGLNYDASDDSIWYSPDASQRVYHYDVTSPTAGTLINFVDVNDPPNDMIAECGFNYNSGVAVGATNIMYLGANGCNTIFKFDKTGAKLGSFSIGTGRTEDMECDSITFASQNTDAVWTKDAFDTELIAFAVPQGTCTFGGGGGEEPTGRMTGGGSAFTNNGIRVTHGFQLNCDETDPTNSLQVNWGKGNKFHLVSLTNAVCSDDTGIMEAPPVAGFNTYQGSGTGRYNGIPGATAEWTFTDAGEPGTSDTIKIVIKDANSNTVLSVSGPIKNGNHQAHAE